MRSAAEWLTCLGSLTPSDLGYNRGMYVNIPPAMMLWFVNRSELVTAVLGMWIRTANQGIQHHGIITGVWLDSRTNQWVLLVTHTTPERGVHVSTLQEFANGRLLALVAEPKSPQHQQMILETARLNIGQPYAVFNSNCEHFASHCYTHQAQSLQLQQGVLLAGLVVAALAVGSTSSISRRS